MIGKQVDAARTAPEHLLKTRSPPSDKGLPPMFQNLTADELRAREDNIFIKCMERKWTLDVMGIIPSHDKAFSFYRWQLEEIDAAKAVNATVGLGA